MQGLPFLGGDGGGVQAQKLIGADVQAAGQLLQAGKVGLAAAGLVAGIGGLVDAQGLGYVLLAEAAGLPGLFQLFSKIHVEAPFRGEGMLLPYYTLGVGGLSISGGGRA